MKVTKHGKRRMKQRCGVGRNTSNSVASRAYNEGIKHKDTQGDLRKWIDGLYLSKKTANNVRLYNHKCYLFCGESLVTVLNIPDNLIEEYKSLDKRTKKNNKKEVYKITLYHPKSTGYTVTTVRNTPYTERIINRFKYSEYDKANHCVDKLCRKEDASYDCIRIINDNSYQIGDNIIDSTYKKYY